MKLSESSCLAENRDFVSGAQDNIFFAIFICKIACEFIIYCILENGSFDFSKHLCKYPHITNNAKTWWPEN